MSLLTPSESRAFQSFLDAAAFPVDWSMQLEISHEHMPPARGTEALTKATKDLMSLDSERWRFPSSPYPSQSSATPAHRQQPLQPNPLTLLYSARQPRSVPTLADEAELAIPLSAHLGLSSAQAQLPFHHLLNMNALADAKRARADLLAYDRSSSSGSSRESPVDLLTVPSSSARMVSSAKRSPPPDAKPSNKRHRLSVTTSQNGEEQLPSQSRSALLSPSQKKANHIQSEQKRRANIRRGYDALCETVPALREACLAEDEQQFEEGKGKSRRRGKGKGKSDDIERIDGRAGPRSENVVLSKSIDYVHELLSEREGLMQRLHVARSALPAEPPITSSPTGRVLFLCGSENGLGGEKHNDDDDDEDDD
ncbi:hypothetical protein JVU11DRAFT_4122 [Chiua virens]|nr:hypothetical protein JVU11DRAFT_4122 [Chiua virens]